MAIIKLGSAAVTQIAGSVDGVTYSTGLGGAYVRTKTVPLNPQTTFQAQVRAVMTDLARGWGDLSYAQQVAWTDWAKVNKITNSLGTEIRVNGLAAYVQINARLLTLQTAANPYTTTLSDPPTTNIVPALTNITNLSFSVATKTLEWRTAPNTPTVSGIQIVVRMSARRPAGMVSTKQPVALVGVVQRVTPVPNPYSLDVSAHRPDIAATYTDDPQKYVVSFQLLNRNNGAITPPIRMQESTTP